MGVILVALGGGVVIVATFLPWISVRTSAVEVPVHGPDRVREYSGWQLAQRCHPLPRFGDKEYFGSLPAVCSVAVEEDTQPVPTGVWTLAVGVGLFAAAGLLAIATQTSRSWARRTLLGLSVVAGVFAALFALVLWAFAAGLYEWPQTHAPNASVGFSRVRAGVALVVVGSALALGGALVACWPRRKPREPAVATRVRANAE